MICQYYAVLLIFTYSGSSQTVDTIPRIYEHPNTTIKFHEIAEGGNGFLYALDQYNRIYRLTGEADKGNMAVSVSPAATGTDDPAPMGSQVLLVSGNPGNISVLACSPGACGLSSGDNWSWTPLDHTMGSNYFSHKQQVRGIVSSPLRDPYYYIAAQDDGCNPEDAIPVLSVRQLKTQPNTTFFTYRQNFGGQGEAKITVNKNFRNIIPFKVKPVFLHLFPLYPGLSFGYLITVQSSTGLSREFESRIGRFCAYDKLLTHSYTEMSLQCSGRNGLYTIAMAGSALIHDDKGYLAVVFGKESSDSWEPARNMETAVCIFTLKDINSRFHKWCTNGHIDDMEPRAKLPWIVGTDAWQGLPFSKCNMMPDFALQYPYCDSQSRPFIEYLDIKATLVGTACPALEGADVRGLQLTHMKLLNASGSMEDIMATIHIENSDLKLRALSFPDRFSTVDQCESELLSTVPTAVKSRLPNQPHATVPASLTNSGRSYVVLSDNKIQSFPVGCGMHATCSQCMAASKRMGCGWCYTGHCSTRKACARERAGWAPMHRRLSTGWDLDKCPPLIEDLAISDNSPEQWGTTQFVLPPNAAPTTRDVTIAMPPNAAPTTRDMTITLVVIGGTLTIAIVAVLAILVRRHRKKPTESLPFSPTWNRDMETAEALLTALNSNSRNNSKNLLYRLGCGPLDRELIENFRKENLIIDSMHLEFGRKLGSGSFGTVYEGLVRGDAGEPASEAKRVAIKTIQGFPTPSSLDDFLKEGLIMKDLRHRNVMTLYGICVSTPDGTVTSPGLVMPFMSNGDLHSYVKENNIELKQILNFAIQISDGMTYLSSQKIVHRDLAARNCMLDDELNVVISDFGHARDLYETNLYDFNPQSQTPLPFRWIAPECFSSSYSTKSDVWSFGVVIWELFEKGKRPYGELDAKALFDCIGMGLRLDQPDQCPDDVYKLMIECWNTVPGDRPEFQNLCVHLRAIQCSCSSTTIHEHVGYLNGKYFSG